MATSNAESGLQRDAERIDQQLRAMTRMLRRELERDLERFPLPRAQYLALVELVREDGLSLTALSERMGLSHSTTSGIVDRLERRRLARRETDPRDRRRSHIVLAPEVNAFVHEIAPRRRLTPIMAALRRATPAQRMTAVDGLDILYQLMRGVADEADATAAHAPE